MFSFRSILTKSVGSLSYLNNICQRQQRQNQKFCKKKCKNKSQNTKHPAETKTSKKLPQRGNSRGRQKSHRGKNTCENFAEEIKFAGAKFLQKEQKHRVKNYTERKILQWKISCGSPLLPTRFIAASFWNLKFPKIFSFCIEKFYRLQLHRNVGGPKSPQPSEKIDLPPKKKTRYFFYVEDC